MVDIVINNTREPASLIKMQALKPSFSQSEQKVIDYILANPAKVIYFSVAELAESSQASDSTVVRTCQKLGYNGYQDLKVTLAQDIVTPLQNVREDILDGDSVPTIVDKVFQNTMHALSFTHSNLKSDSIERAVDALMSARQVMVIGMGNSSSVALDLHHKLTRLGIPSMAFTDPLFQVIASCALLTEKDVLFAISHSGNTIDIVDAAQLANENGVTTISLSNFGISPLSRVTDVQLFTATKDTKFRIVGLSSRIAQMTVVDVLYSVMATRLSDKAKTNIQKLDEALKTTKYKPNTFKPRGVSVK